MNKNFPEACVICENNCSEKCNRCFGDIEYPICPLNVYWEGDEDKCDVSKCDYNTEYRGCFEGCRIKEKPKMSDKIEINVKVNGKDVPLHEVSEQTLLTIRENSKPKSVPAFQIVNCSGESPRLIFKVTEAIAGTIGGYVALDQYGKVCNSGKSIEDFWCSNIYSNMRELKLKDL